MSWQGVLNGIDAVESWIVAQSFWVQVVLLLVVLGPICWLLAGLIDRFVEWVLRRHRLRLARNSAALVGPSGDAPPERTAS